MWFVNKVMVKAEAALADIFCVFVLVIDYATKLKPDIGMAFTLPPSPP